VTERDEKNAKLLHLALKKGYTWVFYDEISALALEKM